MQSVSYEINVKLRQLKAIKESLTQSVLPIYTWDSEGYTDLSLTDHLLYNFEYCNIMYTKFQHLFFG